MKKLWLCEPEFLEGYLQDLASIDLSEIKGEISAGFLDDLMAQANKSILEIKGDVAHISIQGVLDNRPPNIIEVFFGIEKTQYAKIKEAAFEAFEKDEVKEVVLDIHSPGGAVDGLDETYQSLVSLAKTKKLTAVNHGLMASAAYWLAMSAEKITAVAPTAMTGSIGVVVAGYVMKESNYKKVVVTSKNAPNKYASLDNEKGVEIIQKQLDALERIFHQRVANGRGVSVEKVQSDFGQGSVLVAYDPDSETPDALSVGMIDAVINTEKENASFSDKIKSENSEEPKTKEETMTLKELLAQHPECRQEVDALVIEGKNEVRKEVKLVAEKASKYLSTSYPESIKTLATKVISGESHIDSLEAAASAYDAIKEEEKSKIAATETPAETPAETEVKTKQDLESKTLSKEDEEAAINSLK